MESAPDIYDPAYVKGVFDRCSEKYIAFSYICSLGFTERWRKQAVLNMPIPPADAPTGFDLMAGTGEVWPHIWKRLPQTKSITAIDISSGMHKRAIDRLHDYRKRTVEFIEDDVLSSKLKPDGCDFLISTFGLKTFTPEQHKRLADLVFRVLKSGGVFSFVEASDPKGWWLRPLYLFHLKRILPLIERVFMRGAQDFAMIGTYSTNFGNAEQFAEFLRAAGLEVDFKKYFFGCATGVVGRKP
ncbi:class I SAM-dependent methyltransferase [Hyphomonas sp. FCG-A18]|uniref:class I SAM-dependent methyltransferase n=1 Tax=Hyphomonas sp. FCG-A18 TaxID=3080019 RepID=UPI002B306A42|nr:class I SAM-dependent methyltransferase [Hyphomonas sp. FCG-A18]